MSIIRQMSLKPYVMSTFCAVDQVDLVWDTYKADSLKASTRIKQGKDSHRRVSPLTAMTKTVKIFCE